MNGMMKVFLKLLAVFAGILSGLAAIYFFNLDMKFVAKYVDPILQKHYDTMPHNQYV